MVRKNVAEINFVVRSYSKKVSEWNKEVSVENWDINFSADTLEDAKLIAKLAKLTSYGIIKEQRDEKGYLIGEEDEQERVFVTPDVLEWEATEKQQQNDEEARKQAAITAINALPKTVTLYKDAEFFITATRKNADSGYRGFDVKYQGRIQFKGADFEYFSQYVTDGWNRKNGVLRKKFAKDVYEYLHSKDRYKNGWREWENKLKNIPADFVAKYGAVIDTAVKALSNHNAKIEVCKNGM